MKVILLRSQNPRIWYSSQNAFLCSYRNASRWPQKTGFLLPHTRSSHLTYCRLPRGLFFKVLVVSLPLPLVILPLIHCTSFTISFILLRKRYCGIKKRAEGIFLFIRTILFFSFAFFRVVRVWKPLHLALRRKCVSKTG